MVEPPPKRARRSLEEPVVPVAPEENRVQTRRSSRRKEEQAKVEKPTPKARNDQPPKASKKLPEHDTSKATEDQAPSDEESEEPDVVVGNTGVIGLEPIQNEEEG